MKLIIANKNYSSWSMRPWLVAHHFGIPFEEVQVLLDTPDTHESILKHSPSGRVPCLIDGDIVVWETLAIIEYLAETHPDKAIWPRDTAARAMARAIANEMHAGFQPLRNAYPMNMRKSYPWKVRGGDAAIAAGTRIIEAWTKARAQFGAGGPFLFGAFSAADAMYAPVVSRFVTYNWPLDAATKAYVAAVESLPAYAEWKAAGLKETWIVPSDEVAD